MWLKAALLALNEDELSLDTLERTPSCIMKHKKDFRKVKGEALRSILGEIKRRKEIPMHGV